MLREAPPVSGLPVCWEAGLMQGQIPAEFCLFLYVGAMKFSVPEDNVPKRFSELLARYTAL